MGQDEQIEQLKPFAELYAGAKQTADSILAGINEYFDYPFTLLFVLTYGYIAVALWGQGHWIWSIIFWLTIISQIIRISLRFGLRWWAKRQVKKELGALKSLGLDFN